MGVKAVKLYFRGILLLITIAGLVLSVLITQAYKSNSAINLWLQFASTVAPFIIILNFLLLFYWSFRLKIWFLIPLIAVVINFKYLTSNVGVRFSKQPDNKELNITVCSYNVNYFNHTKEIKAPEIAGLMQDNDVDILAMQEFEAVSYYNLDEIVGEFDSMQYSALYACDSCTIGMAIFSKYPIVKSSRIDFRNTGNGFMWADVIIKNDTIRVINAHLQTTGFYSSCAKGLKYILKIAAENFLIRAEQAKIVRSFIDSTAYPVIVCGDFNDTPQGYVYSTIKGNDLQDSFIEKGVGLGGTYRRTLSLMRIDMILVSNRFKVKSHKIINSVLSDHKPIFSKLEYQN